MGYRLARLDERVVEYHLSGPADAASLLVLHVGSPSAAVGYPALTAAAARMGLRTLAYSRPGYARSDRARGRRIADEAWRTGRLADLLGHRRFLTIGWSGGGPAALACAALLPDRVAACLTLASPAPMHEAGAEARDWYTAEDAAEIETLGSDRRETAVPEFEAAAGPFRTATLRRLARRAHDDTERRALLGPADIAGPLAKSMRRAVSRGIWGWFDDNVAQVGDWGFRVADIRVPVAVLHGERDALVDVRQGHWLATAIPGSVGVFPAKSGHASIADPFEDVVERLVTLSRGRMAV